MAHYSVFFKPNFIPDGTLYPNVSTVAGTVAITAGSTAITGTNTHFLSTLVAGSYIAWIDNGGTRRQAKVATITNNTAAVLSLVAPTGSTVTAGAYQLVVDITARLTVGGVPQITVGTQRRENPFLLTYGELSLSFTNLDNYFNNLMNMDKIIGTDPANYRAPLLHYGVIYFARKEFGRTGGFQNIFLGFVDPKSLQFSRDASTCNFTAWGVAKMLEKGNAERVNRFSSLYTYGLPQPFVLSGYDLGHPAAPPGILPLRSDGSGSDPLCATSPAYPNMIKGSHTQFTKDLRIGNTVTINGVSATVLSIEDDGQITLSANWGGDNTGGAFTAFMWHSGQSDSCFRLSRNAAYSGPSTEAKDLQFFPGDVFKGVARVLPADYQEGMDVVEMSPEVTIIGTAANGNDLLIFTSEPIPEASLLTGVASMQMINPWWHGKRYTRLIQLLVTEVNLALASASYSDVLTLIEDAYASTTGQPVLDIIDNNGMIFPVTGFGFYTDSGSSTLRQVAQAYQNKGQTKADFLLDPVAADRTFKPDLFQTAPTLGSGANQEKFISATYGQPFTYPNPSPILAGQAPPPTLSKVPSVGQDMIAAIAQTTADSPSSKIHTRWTLTPTSYASTAASVKYAYRFESFDVCADIYFPVPDAGYWQNKVGFTLARYETTGTVPNEVWAVSTGGNAPATVSEIRGKQGTFAGVTDLEPSPPVDMITQGQVMIYPLGGSDYLYIITDAAKRIAYYYKSTTGDNVAPSTIVAGMTQFEWRIGASSGALYDGANIFYFTGHEASTSLGIGVIAGTSGSGTFTGTNTKFTRDLRTGDKIRVYNLASPKVQLFTVQSNPVSDTSVSVLPVAPVSFSAQYYRIEKDNIQGANYWWWKPSANQWYLVSSLFGDIEFLNPDPIDWGHAMVDGGRQIIYAAAGRTFYRIKYTFAPGSTSGTFSSSEIFTSELDTPNFESFNIPRTGIAPMAWITGPVDVDMGTVDGAVPYASGTDAVLIGTQTQDYIYSDEFAGVIQIADFTGLACSTAIESLIQIPQQVIISGCDTDTTATPALNDPAPTIRLKPRILNSDPPFDGSAMTVSCQDELWICQYNSIQVQNSQLLQNFQGNLIPIGNNINTGIVTNDRSFTFDGTDYQVLAARYGGVNALQIDNPFIFTTSVAKMIANALAFMFLIPRNTAAKLKMLDPFMLSGNSADILKPLGNLTYLKVAPNAYGGAVTATGKISKISYEKDTNLLSLEII